MFKKWNHIGSCLLTVVFWGSYIIAYSQTDATKENKDSTTQKKTDTLLLKKKGIIGTLAQSIMTDTADEKDRDLERNDLPFQKYNNLIIRKILIDPVEFGVMIGDTTKRLNNSLTHLANGVHNETKPFVLRNHLFFRENDLLSPFLLGNNERYLRDLPFLREARFQVKRVKGSQDSVDVFVYTKDVLSIGGSLAVKNRNSGRIEIREDNFMGWGDRLEFQTLYDKKRNDNFGFGAEYIKRNVLGTFIDVSAGCVNFNPAIVTGRSEETIGYARLNKPLVNPFMRWTYAFSAEIHSTANMFNPDSVYYKSIQYKYRLFDAWGGYNLSANKIGNENELGRLRFLVSARALQQTFLNKPEAFRGRYSYAYADMSAVLAAISVFKLNFYKTSYIYGFGRKEDLPEGLEASFTAGYTRRESRVRPYFGITLERYYLLTKKQTYIDYSLGFGSSIYKKRLEDVNFLASMDYFGRLRNLGPGWKQRSFLSVSFARLINAELDPPLLMESPYGFQGFKNNYVGGYARATVQGESVFFSPWRLFYFKFAPFVFSSATVFQFSSEAAATNTRLYTAIGGGIRTRNESLIFGTIELRASYFPKKDAFNNNYVIQLNTNLRFKYNENFVHRPEFVSIN